MYIYSFYIIYVCVVTWGTHCEISDTLLTGSIWVTFPPLKIADFTTVFGDFSTKKRLLCQLEMPSGSIWAPPDATLN